MRKIIYTLVSCCIMVNTVFAAAIQTGKPPFYLSNEFLERGFVTVSDKDVPFVRSIALNKVANVIGLSNVIVHNMPFNEVLVPDAVITRVDSIGNLESTHIGHWANVVKFRVPAENYPYFKTVVDQENLPVKVDHTGEVGGMSYTVYVLDYEN